MSHESTSNEGLGAAVVARQRPLADVKKGDFVALYHRGAPQRWVVERCTATRIEVDGKQYTRRGYAVGASKHSWSVPLVWIEVWCDTKHPVEIARKRAQSRLDKSRATLATFRWTAVTQEQADAVFATMQGLGMVAARA